MTQIKKLAWYGSSVAVAALLAVALVVTGPLSTAFAAPGDVTPSATSVAAGSNVTLTVETNGVDEVQTIGQLTAATSGNFTLTFSGQTTGNLAFNATAAQVETALEALSNVSDVTVTGGPINAAGLTVTFHFGGDVAQLTLNDVDLDDATGGAIATGTAGVTPTTVAAFSINQASTATAQFVQGGGQSVALINGQTGDQSATQASIAVLLKTLTSGALIVDVTAAGQNNSVGINVTAAPNPVATITLGGAGSQLSAADLTANVDVSVALADANGTAVTGRSYTATISGPGLLNRTAGNVTTCEVAANNTLANAATSCTITNASANTDVLEVFSTGVPGTITLTVTSEGVTATRTITVAGGSPSSLSVQVVGGTNAGGTALLGAKSILHDRDVNGGTDATRDEALIVVKALDANGVSIIPAQANVTVKVTNAAGTTVATMLAAAAEDMVVGAGVGALGTVAAGTCTDAIQAAGALGNVAVCAIDIEAASTAPLPRGAYTVTASWVSGTTTLTATTTINIAGPAASVTVDPGSPVLGTNSSITSSAADSDGNPVADGTTITLNVSNANALLSSAAGTVGSSVGATTTGGTATLTLIPVSTGTSVAVGVATGGVTGSQTFTIAASGTTPPPDGEGSFTGTISDSGVSIVSFDGGTVADLAAAAADAGLISVWVTVDGEFVGFISGAPAFVNAAFSAQFAGGIPAGTLAIVVK